MHVVAIGDIWDGITLFGGWTSFEEAQKFAEANYNDGQKWSVIEIAMVHHD